ncbi:hypothetical protein C8R46DRAFT_1227907 [Mycena filopes]|nr:hypothetical protein C8R46DRAFT_1227907 [Mycena filopes]
MFRCVAGRALRPRLVPQYLQPHIWHRLHPAPPPPKTEPPPKPLTGEPENVTAQQQRRTDWRIVKTLVNNVWPKNDWKNSGHSCIRVWPTHILQAAKCPSPADLFKNIIDTLNMDIAAASTAWTIAGTLVLGYGAARIGSAVFGELLNAVFANIGQSA